jgi:glycosyltransferase involved in cell wall biosynthesis
MPRPSISIVTVTLNCAGVLPALVASLQQQSDADFDWIVVDGGSADDTLGVVAQFPADRTTVVSGPDFGIYDALNKALPLVRSDYYLVLGADDRLYPDAVANYRKTAGEKQWDIVAAAVDCAGEIMRPMRGKRWLRGGNAFVASHAVGTLIRRQLHAKCGPYSNRYVNGADMQFVLAAVLRHGASIGAASFVAGEFDSRGISTVDRICSLSDAFRIQLTLGGNKALQFCLFASRLLRELLR